MGQTPMVDRQALPLLLLARKLKLVPVLLLPVQAPVGLHAADLPQTTTIKDPHNDPDSMVTTLRRAVPAPGTHAVSTPGAMGQAVVGVNVRELGDTVATAGVTSSVGTQQPRH